MTGLLNLGSPTIWPSYFGGWLIDDGSLVPQHVTDRRTAYAEAVALTSVPPAGDPLTVSGSRIATAGMAGSSRSDTAPLRECSGRVPGSAVSPPRTTPAGPGAPISNSRAAVVVGTAARVNFKDGAAA